MPLSLLWERGCSWMLQVMSNIVWIWSFVWLHDFTTDTNPVASLEQGLLPFRMVRCTSCDVLVSPGAGTRCLTCLKYRKTLNAMLSRLSSRASVANKCHPSSHTNYRFLTTLEKAECLQKLHQLAKVRRQQIERLRACLELIIEERGIDIERELHDDLKDIMTQNTHSIADAYSPGLFARIFWEQQQQSSTVKVSRSMKWEPMMIRWCLYLRHLSTNELHDDLKDIMTQNTHSIADAYSPGLFARIFWEQQQQSSTVKVSRSMKWEPMMIRWCLYLRHLSTNAYETIRSSGVLKLPSQRTLRDDLHFIGATTGFSCNVDKQLIDAAKIDTCPKREKAVVILINEMHVKEDLVFNKHAGTGIWNLLIPVYKIIAWCCVWAYRCPRWLYRSGCYGVAFGGVSAFRWRRSHSWKHIGQLNASAYGSGAILAASVPICAVPLHYSLWPPAIRAILGCSGQAGGLWVHCVGSYVRWPCC